jgi:hypothetical protein
MRILRFVLGFIVGYAFVVVATTVGFGLLHDHKPYHRAGIAIMIAAVSVAVTAGAGGGLIGSVIARSRFMGLGIAVPLIVESTWLIFIRPHGENFSRAFELVGATTLIGCTIVGGLLSTWWRERHARDQRVAGV